MNTEYTAPPAFVFVLMPIRQDFDNVYQLGIKGASAAAGAYAERVDEQDYDGGILPRITNQISKADIVVADMTGKNPNVFYEVGYAHALNKRVILLTQDIADIPFDLKDRPHIGYDASQILLLKTTLEAKLKWALGEQRSRAIALQFSEDLAVSVLDTIVPELAPNAGLPIVEANAQDANLALDCLIRNDGPVSVFGQVTLFMRKDSDVVPIRNVNGQRVAERSFDASVLQQDLSLTRFYPLTQKNTGSLARNALAPITIEMQLRDGVDKVEERILLRVQTAQKAHDHEFLLRVRR